MENDCCNARIAITADLRNLTSRIRNGEVSLPVAATTLEGALRAWATLSPAAKRPLTEGQRLVSCIRHEHDLPPADVARSIASLTNLLVEAPFAA